MSKTHRCHCISHIFPRGTAQHYVKWDLQWPSISCLGRAKPEALLSPPAPSHLTSQPFSLASPIAVGPNPWLQARPPGADRQRRLWAQEGWRGSQQPPSAEPASEETLLAGGRRGQGGCWGDVGSLCALTPRAAAERGDEGLCKHVSRTKYSQGSLYWVCGASAGTDSSVAHSIR